MKKNSKGSFLTALWWLVAACVAVGLALLQRNLRLAIRQKQFDRLNTNQQALLLWQRTAQLARLAGSLPDAALFQLAEKAKYSPYTLTEAELLRFDRAVAELVSKLQKRSVFHRLYYRFILVIY